MSEKQPKSRAENMAQEKLKVAQANLREKTDLDIVNQDQSLLIEKADKGYLIKDTQDGGNEFPLALPTLEEAHKMRHILQKLLVVHEACAKIEIFKRDCRFYTDKASLEVTGSNRQDLFIDSGLIARKTTALTYSGVAKVLGPKNLNANLEHIQNYLNAVTTKVPQEMQLASR